MYRLLILFIFLAQVMNSQDKLFFVNGNMQQGIVVSVGKDLVFFKKSDTSQVQSIPKTELLMMERAGGGKQIFGKEKPQDTNDQINPIPEKKFRNAIGLQPIAVIFGRASATYEHLNEKGNIGIVIPFAITFDPNGVFFQLRNDSTRTPVTRNSELNFITGADINFYIGKREYTRFFVGPRFRYGTDVFIGVEYYTFQTQIGYRLGNPRKHLSQTVALGYGLAGIISTPQSRRTVLQKYYGMYSLTYRINVWW